jgi:hypothetical protein
LISQIDNSVKHLLAIFNIDTNSLLQVYRAYGHTVDPKNTPIAMLGRDARVSALFYQRCGEPFYLEHVPAAIFP